MYMYSYFTVSQKVKKTRGRAIFLTKKFDFKCMIVKHHSDGDLIVTCYNVGQSEKRQNKRHHLL